MWVTFFPPPASRHRSGLLLCLLLVQVAIDTVASQTAQALRNTWDEFERMGARSMGISEKAINEGLASILSQITDVATSLHMSLDSSKLSSPSLHVTEEVSRGIRMIKQRLGDTADDVKSIGPSLKQLCACMQKLQTTQTAKLASLQESCTYQEGKLKDIKLVQQSQAADIKLLPQRLDKIQGSLKPVEPLFTDLLSRLGELSQTRPAAPAQPFTDLLQAVNQRFTTIDRSLDHLMKAAARQLLSAQAMQSPAELLKSVHGSLGAVAEGMKELLVAVAGLKQSAGGSECQLTSAGPCTELASAENHHQLQHQVRITPISDHVVATASDNASSQPASQCQLEDIKRTVQKLISSRFKQLDSRIAEIQQSQVADRVRAKMTLQRLSKMEQTMQQLAQSAHTQAAANGAQALTHSAGQAVRCDHSACSMAFHEISRQLHVITSHLGLDPDSDGESLASWLSELQDLPRAAVLMVRGLDTVLERFDGLQVDPLQEHQQS